MFIVFNIIVPPLCLLKNSYGDQIIDNSTNPMQIFTYELLRHFTKLDFASISCLFDRHFISYVNHIRHLLMVILSHNLNALHTYMHAHAYTHISLVSLLCFPCAISFCYPRGRTQDSKNLENNIKTTSIQTNHGFAWMLQVDNSNIWNNFPFRINSDFYEIFPRSTVFHSEHRTIFLNRC